MPKFCVCLFVFPWFPFPRLSLYGSQVTGVLPRRRFSSSSASAALVTHSKYIAIQVNQSDRGLWTVMCILDSISQAGAGSVLFSSFEITDKEVKMR